MKSLRSGEAGQALVMALILLALGAAVMVPTLDLAFTSIKYHELIEGKTLESYSADSGIKYALCILYNNPNAYHDHDNPLVLSFTINDRAVIVTAKYVQSGLYQITSRATSVNGRSTTIESYVKVNVGAFAYAVATDWEGNMGLESTIVDSSLEEPGEGNIHSNTDIELTSCTIDGDAFAVGIITGGTVTPPGIVTMGSSPIIFPEIDSDLYEQQAKGPNGDNIHNGNYNVTGIEHLGPLYIVGDLIIENDATLILDGTVYVTRMIKVEKGNVDGDHTLLAEGNIYIEQGVIRSDIIPIYISTKVGGEIYLEMGTTVDGVLYAPYGTVRAEQNVHLYGAIGAQIADIQNCHITYAHELQGRDDIPGAELHTISYTYK